MVHFGHIHSKKNKIKKKKFKMGIKEEKMNEKFEISKIKNLEEKFNGRKG